MLHNCYDQRIYGIVRRLGGKCTKVIFGYNTIIVPRDCGRYISHVYLRDSISSLRRAVYKKVYG